jgi:glutathione-regulated potassium-efflux system ancillary protein KefF
MPRILILLAHPQRAQSRVNHALADAARALDGVAVRDLYALYPDYLIDVRAEQAALAGVQLLVWLHPIHWYGMPPLMKLWLDEVYAYGWAYGPGGDALRGMDLWLATSTGGPEASYRGDGSNRHFFDAFLPPYEQTAALVGQRFLPPLVLHGAHSAGKTAIDEHAKLFAERLRRYPDWPELDDLAACAPCPVQANERPLR